jgi:pyruvate,water dikinase
MAVRSELEGRLIAWLESVRTGDTALVGGKAASLGELSHALAGTGARIPEGFTVTAEAYRAFLELPGIGAGVEASISALEHGSLTGTEASARARALITAGEFPRPLADAIRRAYRELCTRLNEPNAPVAVRSSATMEDQPGLSFAGQHESFLGVRGEEELLAACRRCIASLFTERAFAYREEMGLDHRGAALAVAVHEMVAWPECAAAGVMFTIDTESGFPGLVNVTGNWGLGETVVQGVVTPDEFLVFKSGLGAAPLPILARRKGGKLVKAVAGPEPGTTRTVDTTAAEREALCLTEGEVLHLASLGVRIEQHYQRPMDIEWTKDGRTGELGIIQARPETVHAGRVPAVLRSFSLLEPGDPVVRGVAVGSGIAAGRTRVIRELAGAELCDGEILVTAATSPDWVALMRRAAAIVTDLGGRTSHAAIVSRELGIPAVVGTQDATTKLSGGAEVTVSCAGGSDGFVYAGRLPFSVQDLSLEDVPATRTKVMLNLSIPEAALRWWRLPADGVGLARIEFIVGEQIRAHPMALLHPERVEDPREREVLAALVRGYASGADYFVERLAEGIGRIAASQYPRPVVVRLSDFKSNEYASLVGGKVFEPVEPNPMLGLRGASRYYSPRYREAFAMECQAIRRVRNEVGLDNVVVMIPFCRTVPECDRVLEEMAAQGLRRGQDGLKVWLMCEVPSNVVLAAEFAARIDGFSIGSNDLTQLVLGVDRDSAELRTLFSEKDPAVKSMIRSVIRDSHENGVSVSFCGQAPSDDPLFAAFLVECGIDSISVTPDTLLATREAVARAEATAGKGPLRR